MLAICRRLELLSTKGTVIRVCLLEIVIYSDRHSGVRLSSMSWALMINLLIKREYLTIDCEHVKITLHNVDELLAY